MDLMMPADGKSKRGAQTVLIVSTCWWAFPARIAMAFCDMGFRVEAICPHGHPLRETRAVSKVHSYFEMRPLAALASAISKSDPVLIVPCDDRVAGHLHALHKELAACGAPGAAIIEQSLGNANCYTITESRSDLIRVARERGVLVPETYRVQSLADLRGALGQVGFPAVIKVDGTWGGLGLTIVESPDEAERAFARMSRPLAGWRALKRLAVDRDAFHLLPWLLRMQPVISLQRFIRGRPANCAASCWKGQVLANINVEVLHAQSMTGASTVVRQIDSPQMDRATTVLVGHTGMSGFCGLDFVIEDGTCDVFLIELNPRSTPLSHLALGKGHDPIAALAACLQNSLPSYRPAITTSDVIAFFPQAWHLNPKNPLLHAGYHDVPWEDPALVRELIRLPWPNRGVLARLLQRLRAWGGQAEELGWSHVATVAADTLGICALTDGSMQTPLCWSLCNRDDANDC
jgi:hypothetical protein